MGSVVTLKKFRMSQIPDNAFIVCCGRRRSGKTVLVTDLLHHKRNVFPCGIVLSGTEESNSYYSKLLPDSFIYSDFDEEALWKVIDRQQKLREQQNGKCFVVLDDCAYDRKSMNSKVLKYLANNSRHLNIMVILTIQYCMSIPPDIRNNIDFMFACADNNNTNQKKLYEHYFGNFNNLNEFKEVFRKATANYEVLVLDNVAKTGLNSDTVFWYKANLHATFRMLHSSFWKYHKKHYDGGGSRPGGAGKTRVRKTD
jgi:hypothetical protein